MIRLRDRAVAAAADLAGLGRLAVRPPMPPDPAFRCLTSVVRLTGYALGRIDAVQEVLRRVEPEHRYHLPESAHVTVRNLDAAAAEYGEHDAVVRTADALGRVASFRLVLHGCHLSGDTVFAQALGGGLARARAAVAAMLDGAGDRDRLRRTAGHANLVRLTRRPSGRYLRQIAAMRGFELGDLEVSSVDIVRTDQMLSPGATEVLRTVSLAP